MKKRWTVCYVFLVNRNQIGRCTRFHQISLFRRNSLSVIHAKLQIRRTRIIAGSHFCATLSYTFILKIGVVQRYRFYTERKRNIVLAIIFLTTLHEKNGFAEVSENLAIWKNRFC